MPSPAIQERRLKIALVCDWYIPRLGGIELHLYDLGRQLTRAGHEVHVITGTPGPASTDGLAVHRLKTPTFPKFGFLCTPGGFRLIESTLQRERFDLVHDPHQHCGSDRMGRGLPGPQAQPPLTMTFHSRPQVYISRPSPADPGSPVAGLAGRVFRGRPRPGGGHPDPGRRKAGDRFAANGVEALKWRIPHVAGEPDEIRLVSVMRLDWKKGAGSLLRIFREARDRVQGRRRLTLNIIGDGPQYQKMSRRIERLGLASSVHLAGRLTRGEIREALSRADVFLLPSPLESFGLAALEARCAGVPAIVHAHGGAACFIRHEREGLLAASEQEMADRLVRLCLDDTLRKAIAGHNSGAPADYDWEAVLPRHLDAYRQALALRSSG